MDISTDKMYAKMVKQTSQFAAKKARLANYVRILREQLALKNGLTISPHKKN